jgi:hypothetical protein
MGPTPVKKHSFLLLEILVSLFLSSMLILVCLKSLTSAYLCKKKVAKASQRIEIANQMDKTLFNTFCNADTFKVPQKGDELTFKFHNIIDPDLDFAGIVQGRLFATKDKGALIEISKPKLKKKRTIHLDNEVTKLTFNLDKDGVLLLEARDNSGNKKDFAYLLSLKEANA